MKTNKRKHNKALTARIIIWAELIGYDSLEESKVNMQFVGKECFSFIGEVVDIYDSTLDLINESELIMTLSFIFDDEFFTVAFMARYTEHGIRGYTDTDEPIYGFMECEEIKV